MSNIKYCIPILKHTKKEVLETINKNKKQYDFFEVWLDYIKDLDLQFVQSLAKLLPRQLLLLFRRQNLEPTKLPWQNRVEIIKALEKSDVLFDLDIFSQKKELDFIRKSNLRNKKIISFHNYKQTPSDISLKNIIKKMEVYQPNIYKVSTFCNSENDSIRLLNILISLKEKSLNFIILGMGAKGVTARICGLILGNQMNFAPKTLAEKSAPGQLIKKDLELIAKIVASSQLTK